MIQWTWNGNPETMFQTAFGAFLASPMAMNMTASEVVLQNFLNTARRSKLAVGL